MPREIRETAAAWPLALAAALSMLSATGAGATGSDPFLLGVTTHFAAYSPAQAPGICARMRNLGLGAVREGCYWNQTETRRGVYAVPPSIEAMVDESRRTGVEPLVALCYGNPLYDGGGYPLSADALEGFARYAEFVVRHFQGRVRLFEVWNEWEGGTGMGRLGHGQEDGYVRLLRYVYPRIRAANPDAAVIANFDYALDGQAAAVDRLGALGWIGSLDGVSLHPYPFPKAGAGRLPEADLRIVSEVEARLRAQAGGLEVPLYVTEFGWPSHVGAFGSTEEQQGMFAARACLLFRAEPAVRGAWWYDLFNDSANRADQESNFGLLYPDGRPKPAGRAVRDVAAVVRTGAFLAQWSDPAGRLRLLRFRMSDGTETWAVWTTSPDDGARLLFKRSMRGGSLSCLRAGTGAWKPLGLRWVGTGSWEQSVPVGPMPLLVSGDLSGCSVAVEGGRGP